MIEREDVITALWGRLAAVTGVVRTARNPKEEPSVTDMPIIQFFELPDLVRSATRRGKERHPAYKRQLTVAIESFVQGTTESAVSQELVEFINALKTKLYEGGNTLGIKGVEFVETESSRVLRPPVGEPVAGLGIVIRITYTEDTGKHFP